MQTYGQGEAPVTCCEERIASYKKPKSIDFIRELPKNAIGKVLKRELREPYWRDRTRRV